MNRVTATYTRMATDGRGLLTAVVSHVPGEGFRIDGDEKALGLTARELGDHIRYMKRSGYTLADVQDEVPAK